MTLGLDSTVSLVAPSISKRLLSPSQPLKLGIMASGSGSNFEAIAQAIADEQLNAQIQVLIYNNPLAKAAIRAANRGVEAVLLNHRDYGSREAFDGEIVIHSI